jgi:hypothetical protein
VKRIIKKWVHIPGLHCGSVALRDVTTYWGYNLSESMCFGLGGGLGFFYTTGEDMSPTRIIHLRGPGMEPNFFSLIDKPTSWKYEPDEDKALEIAKEWINEEVPILIQTDIFYLSYYNSSTHFPGHVVSLWGYNDRAEMVFLADTGFEGLQPVSYEDFKKGRSSKALPFPLDNNWFEVNLKKPIPPLDELIPEAILRNAKFMMEGARSPRGESGIRTIKHWAEDLPSWADAPDWKWCVRFAYQVIEKRGTGGGGFRWLYRDFLKEGEEIIPKLKEHKLSDYMNLIGNKWSEMSVLLKDISENEKNDRLFKEASKMGKELGELEEGFYSKVLEILSCESWLGSRDSNHESRKANHD